jgi:hypothetical protein
VEQTLFNLDPKPSAPRHWLDDTWLNSASRPIQNFGEFDWDHVPKIDYAKVLFRQLATPENAKVFDEDVGFVLETFGKIKQIEVTPEEEIEIQAKAFDVMQEHQQRDKFLTALRNAELAGLAHGVLRI